MTWNDTDQFVLAKWDEVSRLTRAHADVQDRLEAGLRESSGPVGEWLASQGYEADLEPEFAEFVAYKSAWCAAGKVPMVRLAVGGICPNGYRRVDCPSPYLWVYIRAPKGSSFDRPARRAFTKRLRASLGDEVSGWMHEEVDDIHQPLGLYLSGYDTPSRLALAMDPKRAADLAIEQFPRLLALSPAIDAALLPVLSGVST